MLCAACNGGKADPAAEAPPKAVVQPDLDANNFKVEHPDQFPLVSAIEHKAVSALNVTGVIQPDIARAVPATPASAAEWVRARMSSG